MIFLQNLPAVNAPGYFKLFDRLNITMCWNSDFKLVCSFSNSQIFLVDYLNFFLHYLIGSYPPDLGGLD